MARNGKKVRNEQALNLYDHGIKVVRVARSCAIELCDDAVDKGAGLVNALGIRGGVAPSEIAGEVQRTDGCPGAS